jgi:hypothetical protein
MVRNSVIFTLNTTLWRYTRLTYALKPQVDKLVKGARLINFRAILSLTLLHRITYDCINVPQLDLYFFTPVPVHLKDEPVPVRNRPDPQHGCADPAPIQYDSSPVVKLDLYIWSTDPDPQQGGEDPVPVLYESTSVLHGYADPVMLHYDSSLNLDLYIWSIGPDPQ